MLPFAIFAVKLYPMSRLENKRILIGVTGGIAAYKVPELVRRIKERGGDPRVVMTESARAFVSPLSLQAVSGNDVRIDLFDEAAESGMGHIELARWAETILIAPATANFIAKMANGMADDLLSTLVLASEATVVVAPAMNHQMWLHPTTQRNVQTLVHDGVQLIGPGSGEQACGEVGPGRMEDPNEIAKYVMQGVPRDLNQAPHLLALSGKRVLMTAGPTFEAIDPVRGITNHSSGKMGYALAEAARDAGATVTLVSGPVSLSPLNAVETIPVVSAENMLDAVMSRVHSADIFIGVAAVADYRPIEVAPEKIKKHDDRMVIEMVKNPDILREVAALDDGPFTVGFAAETENILEHAREKRARKAVDVIAANSVAGPQGAFGHDQNAITLIHDGEDIHLETQDKRALAKSMVMHIGRLINEAEAR